MINYDSILSAFDGKPTLLQWLKMVKKALDESVLKNVDITQNGEKVVFSFNFEDGTSISTPEVTLPKGDKGDKGADIVRIETTGSSVVGVDTESTIRVELSDGSVKQFKTYAKNGSDGVSITGIDTVGSQVVGDETLTTLRSNYSDNTSDEFVVKAKNGKDASETGGNIYTHLVYIRDGGYANNLYFKVYSSKENLTLEDALSQIPTAPGEPGNISNKPKIPVCFNWGTYYGVLSAAKYVSEGGYTIEISGIVDNGSGAARYSTTISNPVLGSDTLLG